MNEPILYYNRVETGSMTDGPDGPRTVVWFQGCPIHCPGCQNTELWDVHKAPHYDTPADLATYVVSLGHEPITITGGEPFSQIVALGMFVHELWIRDPGRPIIIYTGYTWEHIASMVKRRDITGAAARIALEYSMVLVDGPYLQDLDTDYLQWRGSSNQRPINLPASLDAGAIYEPANLVLEDWDTPTIEIVNGAIVGTGGLLADLDLPATEIPRCGQATQRGG